MSPVTGTFTITREDQLPEPGPMREGLHFDMKAIKGLDPRPPEMAKDVSAFANAQGGVLLIGAEEKGAVLIGYNPVERSQALAIIEAYEKAITRFCSPTPVCDAYDLGRDSGFVVALNIAAYPAPPIGVRTDDGTERWSFPVRRGAQTRHLKPEQLATLMDGVYRRKVLQVQAVCARDGSPPIEVLLHFIDAPGVRSVEAADIASRNLKLFSPFRGQITDIDPVRGSFTTRENSSSRSVVIPLDAVTGVWKDDSDHAHRIALSGLVLNDNRGLRYLPG